jgi:hypothetical protein
MTVSIARVKGSRSGIQSLDRHKGEPLLDELVVLKAWLKERVEDGADPVSKPKGRDDDADAVPEAI